MSRAPAVHEYPRNSSTAEPNFSRSCSLMAGPLVTLPSGTLAVAAELLEARAEPESWLTGVKGTMVLS